MENKITLTADTIRALDDCCCNSEAPTSVDRACGRGYWAGHAATYGLRGPVVGGTKVAGGEWLRVALVSK